MLEHLKFRFNPKTQVIDLMLFLTYFNISSKMIISSLLRVLRIRNFPRQYTSKSHTGNTLLRRTNPSKGHSNSTLTTLCSRILAHQEETFKFRLSRFLQRVVRYRTATPKVLNRNACFWTCRPVTLPKYHDVSAVMFIGQRENPELKK